MSGKNEWEGVSERMLLRHPDECSDEQLDTWIRHLVDDQVEEGPRLDYKQVLDLSSRSGKREAAKDISSFANEVGGVLLYGIPAGGVPVVI